MYLVILRHGEAGAQLDVMSEDAGRTLTAAGKDEVKEVAQAMKKLKLGFDAIGTSPLKRARETAEIVAKALKLEKSLEVWEELNPEGDANVLYGRLSKMKRDSSILVVGHEPYLSSVIGEMITGGGKARVALKKAGLAKLDVSAFTPRPTAELMWLLTPRLGKNVS